MSRPVRGRPAAVPGVSHERRRPAGQHEHDEHREHTATEQRFGGLPVGSHGANGPGLDSVRLDGVVPRLGHAVGHPEGRRLVRRDGERLRPLETAVVPHLECELAALLGRVLHLDRELDRLADRHLLPVHGRVEHRVLVVRLEPLGVRRVGDAVAVRVGVLVVRRPVAGVFCNLCSLLKGYQIIRRL